VMLFLQLAMRDKPFAREVTCLERALALQVRGTYSLTHSLTQSLTQ
jgi:hypothetical protein